MGCIRYETAIYSDSGLGSLFFFFCQCSNLAAPGLPTFSLDQVRAVRLRHCFSCCSYSSRTAGNILLIKIKNKKILLILCWCTKSLPPPACLLSSSRNKLPPLLLITLAPFLPSSILPSVLPLHTHSSLSVYSCLLSVPRGSLRLFRQDLSSSVKLQSAHRSAGCLEKADNDIPNPADLQLIAPFHQPSTIILCPQPPPPPHFLTSGQRRCPYFPRQGLRFSIINVAHLHLCIPLMSC